MKKSDLPQDKSDLVNFTREVCYVKNENGKYEAELSSGWDVKTDALNSAWLDIENRIEEAKNLFLSGEASPIEYYMELKLMDYTVLAGYTGFWKWQIKKHKNPKTFNTLNDRKLQKYADAFGVTLIELKKPSF